MMVIPAAYNMDLFCFRKRIASGTDGLHMRMECRERDGNGIE